MTLPQAWTHRPWCPAKESRVAERRAVAGSRAGLQGLAGEREQGLWACRVLAAWCWRVAWRWSVQGIERMERRCAPLCKWAARM